MEVEILCEIHGAMEYLLHGRKNHSA